MKRYKPSVRFCIEFPFWVVKLLALVLVVNFVLRQIPELFILVTPWKSLYQEYKDDAVNAISSVSASDFYTNSESLILAADGSLIEKLSIDSKKHYLYREDIPEHVVNAFIAIEDRRFYQHVGVDWQSTGYAGVMEVFGGGATRGGSTITQQLVKNMFLTFEKSYERKAKEILMALEMEKKFSKDQILEFYINNINFGSGFTGIGSAALGYYHKSIEDCSLSEIALLCGIPNNPTKYNPRINYSNSISRRNLILREMYKNEFITQEEFLTAISDSPHVFQNNSSEFYNYISSYAIKCAVEYMMKYNGFEFKTYFGSDEEYQDYNKEYSAAYEQMYKILQNGGYVVKTSLDPKLQKVVQKSVNSTLRQFKDKNDEGVYKVQGACTLIDNKTGKVVALSGGRTQKDITNAGVRTFNRAYQAYRQPGSTIKPILVYAPALQKGYTPQSTVLDEKMENGPKNSGNSYLGEIPLRTAVEKSKNVVAWKLFEEFGATYCFSFLRNMNFSKLTYNDYYAPAALGGLYYGVNTVEMASAYCTLSNNGIYRSPSCIVDIVDGSGNSIYTEDEDVVVYSKKAAESMTDILTGVSVRGTATGLSISNGMPIACKTGTTNNNTNGWFCGYSPYYTCAVYVGADDNSKVDNLWGSSYPEEIWRQVQESVCSDLEVIAFNLPDIERTDYAEVVEFKETESEHGDFVDENQEMLIGSFTESTVTKNTEETADSKKKNDTDSSKNKDKENVVVVPSSKDGDSEEDFEFCGEVYEEETSTDFEEEDDFVSEDLDESTESEESSESVETPYEEVLEEPTQEESSEYTDNQNVEEW